VAVVNAIYSATGVRIRRLPARPEKVRAGLKEKADHGEAVPA
jgi:CO/xanthine dehydrogenase Mo-binding subunit